MRIGEISDIQSYYMQTGYLVMASIEFLELGPMAKNDWYENEMCDYRWRVIGEASKDDLIKQNQLLGIEGRINQHYRFFYRVVAMD